MSLVSGIAMVNNTQAYPAGTLNVTAPVSMPPLFGNSYQIAPPRQVTMIYSVQNGF